MAVSFLNLLLEADNKRLSKGLKKSKRDIQRYTRFVRADFRKMGSAIRRHSALAAGAVAAMGAAALKAGDDIAKSARNANLSARDYQRMAHSFRIAGSSASAMTKASQGLSRQIVQLQRGSKDVAEYFEQLGIAWKDFEGLSQGDRLRLVIDRLRQLTDESQRTGLAQQLLGRAGKELGSVLASTASEMRALEDSFESAGGVIRETALANIEAFNDRVTFARDVAMAGFIEGLGDALGPTREWGGELRELRDLASDFGGGIVKTTKWIRDHKKEIGAAVAIYATWRVATSRMASNIFKLAAALGGAGAVGGATLAGALAAVKAAILPLVAAGAGLWLLAKAIQAAGRASKKASGDVAGLAKSFRDLDMEQLRTRIAKVQEKIDRLNEVMQRSPQLARESADLMKSYKTELEALTRALMKQTLGVVSLGDEYDRMAKARARALAGGNLRPPAPGAPPGPGAPPAPEEEFQLPPGSATRRHSQVSAVRMRGARRRMIGNLPGTVGATINARLDALKASREEQERVRAEQRRIAQEYTQNLNKAFLDGVNTGDFSSLEDLLKQKLFQALSKGILGGSGGGGSGGGLFGGLFGGGGGFGGGLFGALGSIFGGIFHGGGIIPGREGEPRLILAEAGENVLTPEQQKAAAAAMASGKTINLTMVGDIERQTLKTMRKFLAETAAGVTEIQREQRVQ